MLAIQSNPPATEQQECKPADGDFDPRRHSSSFAVAVPHARCQTDIKEDDVRSPHHPSRRSRAEIRNRSDRPAISRSAIFDRQARQMDTLPERGKKVTDASSKIETILSLIVQDIADQAAETKVPILLIFDVDEGFISPSLYRDEDNAVKAIEIDMDICDQIYDLWHIWDAGERRRSTEIFAQGGKFAAEFIYPDSIGPASDSGDWRENILKRYFNDKPVIYPPWDDDGEAFDL